jgi:hypothetical protein
MPFDMRRISATFISFQGFSGEFPDPVSCINLTRFAAHFGRKECP